MNPIDWIGLWAALQVIGTIFGVVLTVLVFVVIVIAALAGKLR